MISLLNQKLETKIRNIYFGMGICVTLIGEDVDSGAVDAFGYVLDHTFQSTPTAGCTAPNSISA